jgi:hypothetical protein
MANPSKRKGTAHEVAVRDFLQSFFDSYQSTGLNTVLGLNIERLPTEGKNDRGDISGVPGWVIEAKNVKSADLSTAMKEAEREAINARVNHYVVVKHRNGKGVSESYAITPLWLWAMLVAKSLDAE